MQAYLRSAKSKPLTASQPTPIAADVSQLCCRICWLEEGPPEDNLSLVTPCKCTGTMRYVHTSCLIKWQTQLINQKGILASRKCDVCKSPWRRPYHLDSSIQSTFTQKLVLAFDALRPFLSVCWDWWKAIAVANAVFSGLQAGVTGFNLGLNYRAAATSEVVAQPMLFISPFSLFAALSSPEMLPFSTLYMLYTASSTIGFLQSIFFALAGGYGGMVSGFSEGLAVVFLGSMKFMGSFACAGGSVINAVLRILAKFIGR